MRPDGLTHTSRDPVAVEFWTRNLTAPVPTGGAPSEVNVIDAHQP